MVLIPIPVVLNLRLPLRQRIFCAMLFGAGFIVCIAGTVRIKYAYQLNTGYDKTWLFYPTWICGTIELYVGIVSTSLPPLKPLLFALISTLKTTQIVTTIPAIKPLIFRYFPNILGIPSLHSGGPLSTLPTQDPNLHHTQRSTSSPAPSSTDSDIELAKHPTTSHSLTPLVCVSPLQLISPPASPQPRSSSSTQHAKSRPLILQPVVSAFSTYRPQIERADDRPLARPAAPVDVRADDASAWKSPHPLPACAAGFGDASALARSLRTGTSSFNMVPAGHVRVESEENMMSRAAGKGSG